MREIDDIDKRIISAVQANGKITTIELADRVGLSPSPCARRLRLLEEAGIISGYTAIVDRKKVGLATTAFVSIQLQQPSDASITQFSKTVAQWPEVAECCLVSGPQDFLLRVVVADLEDYDRFLRTKLTRLEGVADIETSFALTQFKRNEALAL